VQSVSGVHPATGSRVEYDSLAGPEQELSQGARRLFRTSRLVRLFNPYGRRWIRHQNFALAAPCFRFAQRLGHNAKVGNAGSENAVEVFGLFVHGNLLAPLIHSRPLGPRCTSRIPGAPGHFNGLLLQPMHNLVAVRSIEGFNVLDCLSAVDVRSAAENEDWTAFAYLEKLSLFGTRQPGFYLWVIKMPARHHGSESSGWSGTILPVTCGAPFN
jgi:hypothetical protein